jgi:hypothetical protein
MNENLRTWTLIFLYIKDKCDFLLQHVSKEKEKKVYVFQGKLQLFL